jgi:uncharacterized membrane protein
MPELILRPIYSTWVLVLIGVLLVVSLISIAAIAPRLRRWQVGTLVVLRLLVILLALFAMLRPMLQYADIEKQPAIFTFLVDISRSMNVRDAAGGRSRWESLEETVREVRPSLERLSEDLQIQFGFFDEQSRFVSFDGESFTLPETASGDASAIGAALGDTLREASGKTLAGVVLLTDGRQQALGERDVAPDVYAAQMQQAGTPLYAVAYGSDGAASARDVAVGQLLVNPTVFVRNELVVRADVRVSGFLNRPLPVQLLFENADGEMEEVARAEVTATSDEVVIPVELAHIPEVPGEYKLTVRVEPQDGELVASNNEISTFVTVRKGGVNVLYAFTTPLPEHKFVRWSLASSENIQLDTFQVDPRAARPLEAFPPDAFEPGRYDVYVLADVDNSTFRKEELDRLAELVTKSGAGLLMTGGLHSFGPGSWQRWGVKPRNEQRTRPQDYAGILPVAMEESQNQEFTGPVSIQGMHLQGEQRIVPTRQGQRHYIMLLDNPTENEAAWAALPPLQGANLLGEVSNARLTQILAVNQDNQPMLVVHEVGGGRVMAFAGDTTWRWWMQGHKREHTRFWRQTILWLAKKDQDDESGVWIRLSNRRLRPGERVEITTGAENEAGEALPDAELRAKVILPDGTERPIALGQTGESRQGVFLETELPGDYTVEVEASQNGSPIGTNQARFLVEAIDLELDNPRSDPDLLGRLVTLTGGRRLLPEQLPAVMQELADKGLNNETEIFTRIELWDNWYILLAFCGLLGLEWYLRKRWSLA